MASSGIPIACYGRHPPTGQAVADGLEPEYDLVHMVCEFDTAKSELSRILNGDTSCIPTSSGVGSNLQRPESERRIPRAVTCGGGIPDEEYKELKEIVHKAIGREIPWYKVYPGDVTKYIPEQERKAESHGPPDGKYIAMFFRDAMKGLQ